MKFIHTKIIMIDPLAPAPVTLTGSANYSDNSTTDNEENTVVIRGDGTAAGDAAARRVADVYLTEYQRLFMHFVFRDWAAKDADDRRGRRVPGRGRQLDRALLRARRLAGPAAGDVRVTVA